MDKRIHIVLPEEVVEELDRVAGKRGRSNFIQQALANRLRHERQMAAIRYAAEHPLDRSDHPYWSTPEKVSEWVHNLRHESSVHRDAKIADRLNLSDEEEVRSATS